MTDTQRKRVNVAIEHEFCHKELARTPYSLGIKDENLYLYSLIEEAFEERQEVIPVPVIADESGNKLQKQWDLIVRLGRVTSLVEEVYAVRSSLLLAEEKGYIKPDERQKLILDYQVFSS
jgi:hypothetical protein